MKKTGIITLLLLFLATGAVEAQDYQTALGVRLSSSDAIVNNSISFKHFFGQTAGEVLFSFGDPLSLGLLAEKHQGLGAQGFSWLYGGGVYFGFSGDKVFGAHGIIGLDYKWPGVPINLTLDWKPELNIVKVVTFEPAAIAVSARFTFR